MSFRLKKKFKFTSFFATLVFVLTLLSSCVSKENDSNVLERSAEFRPAWANSDFSGEGTGDKFVVASKTQVPKLELGIKQAQASALQSPCEFGQSRLAEDVKRIAKNAKFASEKGLALASAAKSKLILANFCPRLVNQTVYWELVSEKESNQQSYNIFVLLTMKKQDHVDGMSTIVNHFLSSSSADEKQMASLIKKDFDENE